MWFYSNTKNNCQAGAETGRVTDGELGRWLSLDPPPAENESRSLTYPSGSSSSGLGTVWQVSVCGRHGLWQLRLAGRANLHFTPKHMSRWGLFPLGCTGVFPLPLAWPARPFVTSSALTHSPSVCSSVCLSSSINLPTVGFDKKKQKKPPLSSLIFSHPSGLLCLPSRPSCQVPGSTDSASPSTMLFPLYVTSEWLMG